MGGPAWGDLGDKVLGGWGGEGGGGKGLIGAFQLLGGEGMTWAFQPFCSQSRPTKGLPIFCVWPNVQAQALLRTPAKPPPATLVSLRVPTTCTSRHCGRRLQRRTARWSSSQPRWGN